MEQSLDVSNGRHGFWIDRSEGWFKGTLWTLSSDWYARINIVIGIVFTFAQPSIERIFLWLIGEICYICELCCGFCRDWCSDEATDAERDPCLPTTARPRRRTCWCSCWNICTKKTVAWILSFTVLIVGIGLNVSGVFLTAWSPAKSALSSSSICGVWMLSDTDANKTLDEYESEQGQKESRAGEYARDCYGSQSSTSLNRCSIFATPEIPTLKVTKEVECPFERKDYCAGDEYPAVKFDTGFVDAKLLGINVRSAPKFQRKTICVPLDVGSGFVEDVGEGDEKDHWGYSLGGTDDNETYTFKQYGDPFNFDVRSYTLTANLHVYSKNRSQNYWQPSEALAPTKKVKEAEGDPYSLTILFINPCRIYYEDSCDDPIFPADSKWKGSWFKLDSRARPLACLDWINLLDKDGQIHPSYREKEPDNESDKKPDDDSDKNPNNDSNKNANNGSNKNANNHSNKNQNNESYKDQDEDPAYLFTRSSLNKSTIFHSIVFRGANGLDAQRYIRDDTSLGLPDNQWVIESKQLFHTSLARSQYDALDIAYGTSFHGGNKRYVTAMPKDFKQTTMCGILAIAIPKGYENIRIWPTILVVLAVPIVFWFLGLRLDESHWYHNIPWFKNRPWYQKRFSARKYDDFDQDMIDSGWFDHEGRHILLACFCRWTCYWIWRGLCSLGNLVRSCCCGSRRKPAVPGGPATSIQQSDGIPVSVTAAVGNNGVTTVATSNASGGNESANNATQSINSAHPAKTSGKASSQTRGYGTITSKTDAQTQLQDPDTFVLNGSEDSESSAPTTKQAKPLDTTDTAERRSSADITETQHNIDKSDPTDNTDAIEPETEPAPAAKT